MASTCAQNGNAVGRSDTSTSSTLECACKYGFSFASVAASVNTTIGTCNGMLDKKARL